MAIEDTQTRDSLAALTIDQMVYWLIRFGMDKRWINKFMEEIERNYVNKIPNEKISDRP